MRLQRLDAGRGALYWFADDGLPRVHSAIGGPFDTRQAAYWWYLSYSEERLPEAKRVLWERGYRLLGATPDVERAMGLMHELTTRNVDEVWVDRVCRPLVHWRERATGDR